MMNRLAIVGYLAFALVMVSFVNRIVAQTQPVAGLTSVAVSAGTTGPPSLFANGTVAAPSISFSSSSTTGLYLFSAGNLVVDISAGNTALWSSAGLALASTAGYKFTNADALGTIDTGLGRNAAGVVEVNNGTNGQRASLTTNNGGAFIFGAVTFATLNVNVPAGTTVWCSDCGIVAAFDQTCAGGGAGSLAVKNAANVWKCFT